MISKTFCEKDNAKNINGPTGPITFLIDFKETCMFIYFYRKSCCFLLFGGVYFKLKPNQLFTKKKKKIVPVRYILKTF